MSHNTHTHARARCEKFITWVISSVRVKGFHAVLVFIAIFWSFSALLTSSASAQSNLCDDPISMSGSPTEVRWVEAGTCIRITPIACPCPNPPPAVCTCTVTILGPGGTPFSFTKWDCDTDLLDPDYDDWCITVTTSGEYTFVVDVNPCQTGTITCVDCASCP
jgi:hypothetical protein